MGACTSKPQKPNPYSPKAQQPLQSLDTPSSRPSNTPAADNKRKSDVNGKKSPFFPFYSPSPAHYLFSKKSPAPPPPSSAPRSANSTPRRLFKRPFPPPSPAKHIKAVLLRRHGKNSAATIPEGEEGDAASPAELDRSFGFSKQFTSKYEVGDEVGRGHFGYTCSAVAKKGDLKGQQVAVKVIPKAKVSLISLPYPTNQYVHLLEKLFFLGISLIERIDQFNSFFSMLLSRYIFNSFDILSVKTLF